MLTMGDSITHDRRHADIYDSLRLDLKIAADGNTELGKISAEEICRRLQGTDMRRNKDHRKIYDAASAVYCHDLYFKYLLPQKSCPSLPEGRCADLLRQSFGSPGNFFYLVRTLASGTLNPGFLWLYSVKSRKGTALGLARLPLYSLPEFRRFTPLMCIDLWEHAYIDRWGIDISGFADSCLRQTNWEEIFTKIP